MFQLALQLRKRSLELYIQNIDVYFSEVSDRDPGIFLFREGTTQIVVVKQFVVHQRSCDMCMRTCEEPWLIKQQDFRSIHIELLHQPRFSNCALYSN